MHFDVAIIGYGPVGATAVALLAGRGLRVAIADQTATVFDKPRAITGDHELMRIMQFAGIGEAFGRHVKPHGGTQYLGVDHDIIKVVDVAPPPFPLGWPTGLHFIQPEFEAMLRAEVASRDGVEIFLSHQLVDFAEKGERIAFTLRGPGGEIRSMTAGYLLACDGANSFVRRRLDIPYEDLEFDEPWIVVDAWLKRESALPPRNTQYCWPTRPGTCVIGPRNLRRWEIKILPDEDPSDFHEEARLRQVLAGFVDLDAIDLWRFAVYRFHALVATGWRRGRIFLLGDSAHQMPPFMGQGMCSGIRDASNLAWKLLAVEKQGADPSLLDTYEAERRRHVREVITLAKERGLIIGELDVAAARRRDTLLRAERNQTGDVIRHRLIPGLCAGAIDRDPAGRPAPAAGSLFPQPSILWQGGERLMDDILPASFLVVARAAADFHWIDDAAARLFDRLGAVRVLLRSAGDPPAEAQAGVTTLTEATHLYRDWATERHARIAVVRPDRYVYGLVSGPSGLAALVENLDQDIFDAAPKLIPVNARLKVPSISSSI